MEKLIKYEEALNVAIQILPEGNEVADTLEEIVKDIGEEISAKTVVKSCPYCRNKRFWGPETDDDPAITVEIELEGKLFVRHILQDEGIEIPINFCPICGRDLRV